MVGDSRKYTHTTSKIKEIFLDFTPEVEGFRIDESCLDITHSLMIFGSLIPDKKKGGSQVIPPNWRPDGIKNIT